MRSKNASGTPLDRRQRGDGGGWQHHASCALPGLVRYSLAFDDQSCGSRSKVDIGPVKFQCL